MEWEIRLINVYCEVCKQDQNGVGQLCERMSPNATPEVTDEELITMYLFGIMRRIDEHTGIQMASKVRSLKGLNVHVFGRLTVAMFLLTFNS